MLCGKTIAVVVPAYNEESQIGMVIETMPEFVDRIVIVNDCSKDATAQVVKRYISESGESTLTIPLPPKVIPDRYNEADVMLERMYAEDHTRLVPSKVENQSADTQRIILINHLENGGVGAAISTGYVWCRDRKIDCTAVMAGDGQMAPDELEAICLPVVQENIDYVKGNRLGHKAAARVIPKKRHFGNSALSLFTKLASGYWHVSDTQTGYTAISLHALESIDIPGIYRSYGMPNDLLVKLNIENCTLREIVIKPVYRVGEQSKMKIMKVIPRVSLLLLRLFFQRLWKKYFIRSFHPLFLFYMAGLFALILSIFFLVIIIFCLCTVGTVPPGYYNAFILLVISGFQAIGFGMWMDSQDNERLQR